jgi:hypothetical protein
MRKSFLLLIMMLLVGACGQTPKTSQPNSGAVSPISGATTAYQSSSGTVSSENAVTGNLQLGGSFVSPASMGSGCYYGGCPAWRFSKYPLSYLLPDGMMASFTNFTGTANFTVQSDVQVSGTASGNDSTGAPVQVSVSWAWSAVCWSGRDGGCTKEYLSGTLTVTK